METEAKGSVREYSPPRWVVVDLSSTSEYRKEPNADFCACESRAEAEGYAEALNEQHMGHTYNVGGYPDCAYVVDLYHPSTFYVPDWNDEWLFEEWLDPKDAFGAASEAVEELQSGEASINDCELRRDWPGYSEPSEGRRYVLNLKLCQWLSQIKTVKVETNADGWAVFCNYIGGGVEAAERLMKEVEGVIVDMTLKEKVND